MTATDRLPTALIRAMVQANFHAGGLRCLRLFRLDPDLLSRLADEVRDLVVHHPPSDVRRPDHPTHWTRPRGAVLQWSLLNASGRFDDPSMDHDRSTRDKRFHHAAAYPALAAFIRTFAHATNMRVAGLDAHAELFPHEDHVLVRAGRAYAVRARFHLPVVTNPTAEIFLDGEWFHFEAGILHYMNNGCVHAAVNGDAGCRYHLIWDMPLTRETYELLFAGLEGPRIPFATRVPPHDRALVPRRSERVGPYTISHPARRTYTKLQLHRLGVPPARFGRAWSRACYQGFFRRLAPYGFAAAP
jgi:Aspartyl/Asparaginyl beta-hydroxylase